MTCCNPSGRKRDLCPAHLARRMTYSHAAARPVIQRIDFGYKKYAWGSMLGTITVYVELRISSGKARTRPPWTSVFCLTARPDLSGTGVRHVVCEMVKNEIKRLGWGYSRGVRCEP